ncbi:hypothetical protein A6X21_04570 [Planctopirus hydrillae]|uniref:Uncharacterized protein n=1 Tax=Planctopirus hydrillae TaxID=1841610 RepID=A0A1C3ENW9_9PLAN|nr:hypothetical protein A6X21_04570 [Planctopirus hydrillae]
MPKAASIGHSGLDQAQRNATTDGNLLHEIAVGCAFQASFMRPFFISIATSPSTAVHNDHDVEKLFRACSILMVPLPLKNGAHQTFDHQAR